MIIPFEEMAITLIKHLRRSEQHWTSIKSKILKCKQNHQIPKLNVNSRNRLSLACNGHVNPVLYPFGNKNTCGNSNSRDQKHQQTNWKHEEGKESLKNP